MLTEADRLVILKLIQIDYDMFIPKSSYKTIYLSTTFYATSRKYFQIIDCLNIIGGQRSWFLNSLQHRNLNYTLQMTSKPFLLVLLLAALLPNASAQCSVQRCCFASPCTNTYCQQRNSQTWISSQNFANYGYTKLTQSAGSCLPCSYNCQSCASQTVCSTCASGFYMSNSTCVMCSYMCSTCVVANNIAKCSACSGSTYLDSTTASCKSCPTGASVCTSATVISQCQSGYYLTSNSLFCLACPSNCQSCPSSNTVCSSCKTGYYLSSSQCHPCAKANCISCAFFGGNQYCTGCNSGFYAGGGNCNSCPANCAQCIGATCTTCSSGFFLSGGSCSAALSAVDNCNTYQTSSTCASCSSGYYLSSSLCVPCSILCTTCTGFHFGACSACSSTSNLFNQMCLPNSYLSTSVYQAYYSFPSASSLLSQGTQDCNHFLYSGITLTLNLNDLAASQVTLKWRIFSVGSASSYALSWTNSAGTTSSTFSTSSSAGQTYPLCSSNPSSLYHLHIGTQDITAIKTSNTLSFSSSTSLALQQILITATKCNSLCTQCSSSACSQCQMTNLFTQGANCVYSCSSGYYIYTSPNSTQNSCVQSCPSGSFALSSNLSCVSCASPCSTCTTQTSCLSCLTGFFLSGNQCLTTCPYQYYGQTLTLTCQKCVGRCNQCLDQTRCLSCNSGFYYASNNSCLDTCDSSTGLTGMYANLTTLNCQSCNSSCKNCLLESTYCTQCSAGLVFYNNTCLSSCPTGYFANNASLCIQCQYPCQSCSNVADNCTSCVDRYLLNNGCVTDCPLGYFQDNTNLGCTICAVGCSQCVSSASNCRVCSSNYYLFNNTCLSTCPEQFFPNTTSLVCQACVGSCYACTSETNCLSCSSNFLWNGNCVNSQSCPSQYYADIQQLKCLACGSNCLTCQYTSTTCTSCNTSTAQPLLDNGACVSTCSNTSTYADSSTSTCQACNSPCLTCSSATACLSCVNGYMLSGTSCSTSCSSGFFFSVSASDCQACLSGCLACTNALFCQKCQAGNYIKSINSTSNQCVSNCGSQMYINSVSGSCMACIYPCLNCISNVECSSCQDGVLYQGRCVSVCPDTTFLNTTASSCDPCAGNCLTCSQSATHCLTCQANNFLSTLDNSCNSACPVGTYAQNVTQQCLQCPSSCTTCSNSTFCLSCVANRTYLYTTTNVCLTDCPLGFFANTTTVVCDSCDPKCLTCSGSAANCLSCATSYYLVRLSVSTYDCRTTCPDGYYQQTSNCQACIFPCLTCSSATACLTCVVGTYFYSATSSCLLACPANSYLDTAAQNCTLCTSPCASCRNSSYCLSCISNLFLTNGQCLSSCPNQYYADTTQICTQCTGLCKTCSSKYFCLSCLTGYLNSGFCYSSCPAGTFANLNNSVCQTCLSPCLQCTLSTSYCTRCTGGMLHYLGNCSSTCPNGTYQSDASSCLACTFPCITCSSASTCSQCLGGYLLYNSLTCINDTIFCPNDLYKKDGKFCIPQVQCPSNYYSDSDLKTCSTICSASKYLSPDTQSCVYQCQSYQYVGMGMVCTNFTTTPPASLMGMSAISFIAANIMNIVVSFNQTQIWQSGATNLYSMSAATSRLLATSLLYNLDSANQKHLILKVASLPNKVSFSLPAQNVLSSATNYPLQTPNITLQFPSFVTYDYNTIYQGKTASQFGFGLGWFILLLTLIYLFKNRISHLYTLWDTVQLLYVVILLEIQYPPALDQFLNGLSSTLFIGFPNMFGQGAQRTVSARAFYAYTYDNNFLRNAGPSLTIGIIVFIIYLFFKIMSQLNKRTQKVKQCLNNYPKIKRLIYQTLLRFRWHYASDVFFLTYLSVFLFAVAEIYHIESNPGRVLSNIVCVVSLIIYTIFPIFAGVKLHRHFPKIAKGKHSENLRCFYRGIDKESRFGVFLIMIRYFRKLIYALIIGIFSSRPMYALPILMFTSMFMALFIFLNLPFKKRLSNVVEIINECCISFIFLCLALIQFNNQQNYTGFNIALSYVCTGILIFILLMLVFEVFVRSLFKLQSEADLKKQKEQKLEQMSQSQLRRKAGEFFDFVFPKIKKEMGFNDESDEQSYEYEEGDSQDSQNNYRRKQKWGIVTSSKDEKHSQQFKHYNGSESEETTGNNKQAPDYLVRCVKQL